MPDAGAGGMYFDVGGFRRQILTAKEDAMLWTEIREAYPDQWLIVEALEAHTTPDRHRHLDRMAVVEIAF